MPGTRPGMTEFGSCPGRGAASFTLLRRAGTHDSPGRAFVLRITINTTEPHPEERALARVSKDGRNGGAATHPSRRGRKAAPQDEGIIPVSWKNPPPRGWRRG